MVKEQPYCVCKKCGAKYDPLIIEVESKCCMPDKMYFGKHSKMCGGELVLIEDWVYSSEDIDLIKKNILELEPRTTEGTRIKLRCLELIDEVKPNSSHD